MASLNKVFLIGNLTQDPELRYTPNGAAVTDLRMAINRVYTTKEGDRREEVLFIDVTVWNRQAENCCQFLRKGRPIHVEGYLRMESWDDRNTGEKRSKIKVEAERVQFLGSGRGEDTGAATDEASGAAAPAPPRRSPSEPRSAASNGLSRSYGPPASGSGPAPGRRPVNPEPDEPEDDIPF